MIKIIKKIVDVILWLFLAIAVVILLLLGGVRLFGVTPFVVMSGSMIPVYPVGSVVYVEDVNPEELQEGDDITFRLDDDIVATHRINEVYIDEREVQTYGVNNFDSEGNHINDARNVDFDHIIGRVKFSIPIVGFVYMFIQTVQGKVAIVIIALALFIMSQTLQYLEKERKR